MNITDIFFEIDNIVTKLYELDCVDKQVNELYELIIELESKVSTANEALEFIKKTGLESIAMLPVRDAENWQKVCGKMEQFARGALDEINEIGKWKRLAELRKNIAEEMKFPIQEEKAREIPEPNPFDSHDDGACLE